ncbi:MAG: 2Fe-2S iron-sulfur cluster-binding protein [Phormidesmis sp.]
MSDLADTYNIRIHDRQKGVTYNVQVPSDRYILHTAENQAADLPFACRNGACTACAVRVLSGEVYQPEAMGLSPDLRKQGYALLCVSYPRSDLEVETQDEDEVYELQFGRYFGKGKVRAGLPLEDD